MPLTLTIHGDNVVCYPTVSPLLNTLKDGTNYIMDMFPKEDMLSYVSFLNTGTISPKDVFNPDLYIYMGHKRPVDNVEYWKVRLMEEWNEKFSSDGLNSLVMNITSIPGPGVIENYLQGLEYCASNTDYDEDDTTDHLHTIHICMLDANSVRDISKRLVGNDIKVDYSPDELTVRFEGYPYDYSITYSPSVSKFAIDQVCYNVIYHDVTYACLIGQYILNNRYSYINYLYDELITVEDVPHNNKLHTISWTKRIRLQDNYLFHMQDSYLELVNYMNNIPIVRASSYGRHKHYITKLVILSFARKFSPNGGKFICEGDVINWDVNHQ